MPFPGCRYGFSDKIGPLALNYEDRDSVVSTETKSIIEQEIKNLTSEAYARVQALLEAHRDELHIVANALLERETLTGSQIHDLLGRPQRASK